MDVLLIADRVLQSLEEDTLTFLRLDWLMSRVSNLVFDHLYMGLSELVTHFQIRNKIEEPDLESNLGY